jgi:uncharacterized protein (TIGR03118 family)
VVEGLEERALMSSGPFLSRTNLVSDQAGHAMIHDPNLVNAWGIGLSPTGGAFWVSDNGTSVTTLYSGGVNGQPFQKVPLTVTIPRGSPTGQVFNPTNDFVIHSGAMSGPAVFIFAGENGTISGWNPTVPPPPPSMQAQVGVTFPKDVFKGITLGNFHGQHFLYAADFRHGRILVLNTNFKPVRLAGTFHDPTIPTGFAPFDVQNINGRLFVTYAKQLPGGHDDAKGPGNGFVDVFSTGGVFLKRLVSHGPLNSPWGLAMAPSDWGKFAGALLVGNFGNGEINAFNPVNGHFLGTMMNNHHTPLVIDGLWGLTFGNGVSAGKKDVLFFSAGPHEESHGLFGSLTFVRQ